MCKRLSGRTGKDGLVLSPGNVDCRTCGAASETDSADSPDSVRALADDATKAGCGLCFSGEKPAAAPVLGAAVVAAILVGIIFAGAGAPGVGRETLVFGVTSTGFAGAGAGPAVAGLTVAVGVLMGALLDSFLRSSPRATRSVPLACSTLIGLVRTRFAPMRKAFATPAWPSTTATARADWLFGALRALLKSRVAFCSLSQSTTMASKCSAIIFLTVANGSVHGVTAKSNSLRTCVTVRAVFSSGQKRSAW